MKKLKKGIALLISLLYVINSCVVPAAASEFYLSGREIVNLENQVNESAYAAESTQSTEEFAMGYELDSEGDINAALIEEDPEDIYGTLPSSVDLSTSPYFPSVIGNQGSIGSCCSFASVYYQFTYEANKLNNITSDSNTTIYSPAYVYNVIAGGQNTGTSYINNYTFLKEFGCVSLEEFPYYSSTSIDDWNDWCTDTEAMREALSTRLTAYETMQIPVSSTTATITSATDTDLDTVKKYLSLGKVLTVSSYFQWNVKKGYGTDSSENIAYRCYKSSGSSHAFAIVGYDDTIECDVNGNGTIEAYERGAFKVVNSWGTKYAIGDGIYSTDGYFWILYDALNTVSANSVNDWEDDCTGTRCSAFLSNNTFWMIYVENKEVDFVGEFDFTTVNRNKLSLACGVSKTGLDEPTSTLSVFPKGKMSSSTESDAAYSGKLVFDYSQTPVNVYYTGYDWYVRFNTTASFTKSAFAITDNLGNVISDFGTLKASTDGAYTSQTISLSKGDVNYDGSISVDDALLAQRCYVELEEFSNVQLYLGDMDNDGDVDINDSQEILRIYVNSQ